MFEYIPVFDSFTKLSTKTRCISCSAFDSSIVEILVESACTYSICLSKFSERKS